jgi:hypothetical protein
MIERFLHHMAVEPSSATETLTDARLRLGHQFPRATLRRMSHLGLLAGTVLAGTTVGPEDAVVLATTFAATLALEEFLRSFPTASPLLFQSSIHPGSVQQVLIGRQQPVARLWPLAGRTRIVEQALLTALLEPAANVVLIGGEERGTWMAELDCASASSFAFATVLTATAAGALAQVRFTPGSAADEVCPTLAAFTTTLANREPLHWSGAGGDWSLTWR